MTRHRFGKFSRPDFLVPVKALSKIFRAKFRDPLKQTELFTAVEANVWQQAWVVHSEAVGTGLAAFKYLAPYIFRVAISNHRILCLQDGRVTCTFKESAPDQVKRCTVTAKEFIRCSPKPLEGLDGVLERLQLNTVIKEVEIEVDQLLLGNTEMTQRLFDLDSNLGNRIADAKTQSRDCPWVT